MIHGKITLLRECKIEKVFERVLNNMYQTCAKNKKRMCCIYDLSIVVWVLVYLNKYVLIISQSLSIDLKTRSHWIYKWNLCACYNFDWEVPMNGTEKITF